MNNVFNKEMLLRHWQSVVRGLEAVDHVLRRRQQRTVQPATAGSASDTSFLSLQKVALIVLVFGPVYGAAMGSYLFVSGERTFWEQIPQMFYSGIKVPLLLLVTLAISLPSFFVINTLLGLRDDFREALRAIVSAQAGLAIILVSFFPITLFAYVSLSSAKASYSMAVLFNAAMFGLASVAAQVLLGTYYREMVKRNLRHIWMIRMWIVVYAFVGIQVAYVLRPFIGSPGMAASFLRQESFQNAYVKVFSLICDVIGEMF